MCVQQSIPPGEMGPQTLGVSFLCRAASLMPSGRGEEESLEMVFPPGPVSAMHYCCTVPYSTRDKYSSLFPRCKVMRVGRCFEEGGAEMEMEMEKDVMHTLLAKKQRRRNIYLLMFWPSSPSQRFSNRFVFCVLYVPWNNVGRSGAGH